MIRALGAFIAAGLVDRDEAVASLHRTGHHRAGDDGARPRRAPRPRNRERAHRQGLQQRDGDAAPRHEPGACRAARHRYHQSPHRGRRREPAERPARGRRRHRGQAEAGGHRGHRHRLRHGRAPAAHPRRVGERPGRPAGRRDGIAAGGRAAGCAALPGRSGGEASRSDPGAAGGYPVRPHGHGRRADREAVPRADGHLPGADRLRRPDLLGPEVGLGCLVLRPDRGRARDDPPGAPRRHRQRHAGHRGADRPRQTGRTGQGRLGAGLDRLGVLRPLHRPADRRNRQDRPERAGLHRAAHLQGRRRPGRRRHAAAYPHRRLQRRADRDRPHGRIVARPARRPGEGMGRALSGLSRDQPAQAWG